MFPVSGLGASVRYALSDMQGTRYSDFDVLEGLNQAAQLLYVRMAARAVKAAVKKVVFTIADGDMAAALPENFHSVRRVSRDGWELAPSAAPPDSSGYRISGGEFQGTPGVYGLEYYGLPAEVSGMDEELDIPPAAAPWLVKIAVALMTGDTAAAAQAAEGCCGTLAGGEVGRLPGIGPVQVLGGKL